MAERGVFAERLRQLREQAGLTHVALSKRSGVSISAVRQFEYGVREPNYRTLLKLAHGLGVSLSAFDAPPGPARTHPERPWTDWRPCPNGKTLMSTTLRTGDRVRSLVEDRLAKIRPGDRGIVLEVGRTNSGARYYVVAMADPGPTGASIVFAEGEIEPDDNT